MFLNYKMSIKNEKKNLQKGVCCKKKCCCFFSIFYSLKTFYKVQVMIQIPVSLIKCFGCSLESSQRDDSFKYPCEISFYKLEVF